MEAALAPWWATDPRASAAFRPERRLRIVPAASYAPGMPPESRKRKPKPTKQTRKKTRAASSKGRALEELVSRLEAAAAGGRAEVKSPEFFMGKNSQSKREVDVTVRSKVGNTPVLVMFECS